MRTNFNEWKMELNSEKRLKRLDIATEEFDRTPVYARLKDVPTAMQG